MNLFLIQLEHVHESMCEYMYECFMNPHCTGCGRGIWYPLFDLFISPPGPGPRGPGARPAGAPRVGRRGGAPAWRAAACHLAGAECGPPGAPVPL